MFTLERRGGGGVRSRINGRYTLDAFHSFGFTKAGRTGLLLRSRVGKEQSREICSEIITTNLDNLR